MFAFRHPVAGLLCAGSIAMLAAPAFADQVSPLTVAGKLPTSIAISVVGKSASQVRSEIRAAASTVCRNAFNNGDLGFYGDAWCPIRASDRAYDRYDEIIRARSTVALLTIEPGTTS